MWADSLRRSRTPLVRDGLCSRRAQTGGQEAGGTGRCQGCRSSIRSERRPLKTAMPHRCAVYCDAEAPPRACPMGASLPPPALALYNPLLCGSCTVRSCLCRMVASLPPSACSQSRRGHVWWTDQGPSPPHSFPLYQTAVAHTPGGWVNPAMAARLLLGFGSL